MKSKKLLLPILALYLFLSANSSAQETVEPNFARLDSLVERFNRAADYKDEKIVFKLLQFNAPYNGAYQFTFLNKDGKASTSTVTAFSTRNGRRASLSQSQTEEIKKKLSDFVSSRQDYPDSPMVDGQLYSTLVFNDGQKFVRYNFNGQVPYELQQLIDFLDEEFNKAEKIRYEEYLEEERILKEKYGDWLNKPGIVRPGTSGGIGLQNENTALLSQRGFRQPVSDDKKTEIPIYYALVFYPADGRMIGGAGSSRSSDPISRNGIGWAISKGYEREKEFIIQYDAINFSVKIEDMDYRLKKGNLFIVRFDSDWKPKISQLKIFLDQPTGEKNVIALFNKELGGETLKLREDF